MKWRSVCSRKSSKTKWQTWEAMSGYQKVEQLLLKAAIKKSNPRGVICPVTNDYLLTPLKRFI